MGGDAAAGGTVGGGLVVAAFDFDGTLTRGGSVVPFLCFASGRLRVGLELVRHLPAIARAGILGGTSADTVKEALFSRLLAGMTVARAQHLGEEFAARHLGRRLRRDTRHRLEWHRKQGHVVVVVSASPECYVRPAAALLGADTALATRLAVGGDRLTGRYEGRNCRGPEKYARLAAWLYAEGLGSGRPEIWAYGNSRGDLRLLDAADHGVDAGRLGRLGRLRRFPSLAAVAAAQGPA